jgi:hypothetical protein
MPQPRALPKLGDTAESDEDADEEDEHEDKSKKTKEKKQKKSMIIKKISFFLSVFPCVRIEVKFHFTELF